MEPINSTTNGKCIVVSCNHSDYYGYSDYIKEELARQKRKKRSKILNELLSC